MRAAIVLNPAKFVDPEQARATIRAAFGEAGLAEPAWYETTVDDPGFGQTRSAIAAGAEVVFACGGDGTVRACAHALAGGAVSLAILPAGTGNLLVANLGLPVAMADVIAAAASGNRRRIDLGRADDTHFAVMAGMGFDAELMAATPERWKRRVGWLAYVVSGLSKLRDRPLRVSISLDGAPSFRRAARAVLIANVGRLPGGIDLFGDARPDDGRLDVAVLGTTTLRAWFALAVAMVLRRQPQRRHLETFRAATVDVRTRTPAARELDGDPIAAGRRLSVTVDAAVLLICTPTEGDAQAET